MIAKRSGYFRTASCASSFEVGIPQHRMDQRPVHPSLVHRGDRLLGRVWLLAMLRGRRPLLPEMNLGIDNQHPIYPFRSEDISLPQHTLVAEIYRYHLKRFQSGLRQEPDEPGIPMRCPNPEGKAGPIAAVQGKHRCRMYSDGWEAARWGTAISQRTPLPSGGRFQPCCAKTENSGALGLL